MNTLDCLFLTLLSITALQRLWELVQSRRNQQRLSSRGFASRESSSDYTSMVALHSTWFLAMLLEWKFPVFELPDSIRALALLAFVFAQILRFWTLRSLGHHWNTQVMAPERVETPSLGPLTEEAMISGKTAAVEIALEQDLFIGIGPYKFIRHPNYLAVIVEIAALPLIGSAALTAVFMSVWNNHILNKRIDLEESWLFSRPGYHEMFYHKSRFIPF